MTTLGVTIYLTCKAIYRQFSILFLTLSHLNAYYIVVTALITTQYSRYLLLSTRTCDQLTLPMSTPTYLFRWELPLYHAWILTAAWILIRSL